MLAAASENGMRAYKLGTLNKLSMCLEKDGINNDFSSLSISFFNEHSSAEGMCQFTL